MRGMPNNSINNLFGLVPVIKLVVYLSPTGLS